MGVKGVKTGVKVKNEHPESQLLQGVQRL